MLRWIMILASVALLAVAGGCSYSSTQASTATATSTATQASQVGSMLAPGSTVWLDCPPRRLSTTVQFQRIPSAGELADAARFENVERIILELPGWPEGFAQLQPLEQAPAGIELVAILPGYPPGARQADAWNLLSTRVRIIVMARGAPTTRTEVQDLNSMRGLERVVVWTDDPRAVYLDRLIVPLSYRVAR